MYVSVSITLDTFADTYEIIARGDIGATMAPDKEYPDRLEPVGKDVEDIATATRPLSVLPEEYRD